jgi:type III secretion protein Q
MTGLALRKVSRDSIPFHQKLGLRLQAIQIHIWESDWSFFLCAQSKTNVNYLILEFDWGGAKCIVCIEEAWIHQIASVILESEISSDLPPMLREFVFEAALEDIAQRIEEISRKRWRLISSNNKKNLIKNSNLHGFYFSFDDGRTQCQGEIWLDELGLGFLANAIRGVSHDPRPLEDFNDLTIPLQWMLGYVDISIQMLNDLEIHDVLMLDVCYVSPDLEIILKLNEKSGIRGQIEGNKIIVDEILGEFMNELNEHDEERVLLIDGLSIRVSFDIGESQLSISELRNLSKGYIFEMGRDLQQAVTIRANGRIIGEGELIDIEGKTGVVIQRILPVINRQDL